MIYDQLHDKNERSISSLQFFSNVMADHRVDNKLDQLTKIKGYDKKIVYTSLIHLPQGMFSSIFFHISTKFSVDY